MNFFSILYNNPDDGICENNIGEPSCFSDLYLDQILLAVTKGYEEYDLKPFFYDSLHSPDIITYRHEIFRELEDTKLSEAIKLFSQSMRIMRKHLGGADKVHYKYQKERCFLDAAELYCEAVQNLLHSLSDLDLRSRGFLSFREYLNQYVRSSGYVSLIRDIEHLKRELAGVRYCLYINGREITVLKAESDSEYLGEVEAVFGRFIDKPVQPFNEEFPDYTDMNHIEAKILDLVAKLHPDVFLLLDEFQEEHDNYPDKSIVRFDREIQFYISYLELTEWISREGLFFCIPVVSDTVKEVCCSEVFDLALAISLGERKEPVVANDFYLEDKERIFVITGPNQGGKTTFARTFGQLHFLARIGCPVPGKSARLFLPDKIFTHFKKEENIIDMRSNLEDDLIRIHSILTECTPRSIIIINEMFTSTSVSDALFLGKKVMEYAIKPDLLCIYVTFLDELSTLEKVVSIASTVALDDPDLRTYKVVRKPADGLSYAIAIARKNFLTYENILERIQS
jgi:hypothetical protein